MYHRNILIESLFLRKNNCFIWLFWYLYAYHSQWWLSKGRNSFLVIYLMCLIIAAVFDDHIYNSDDNFANNWLIECLSFAWFCYWVFKMVMPYKLKPVIIFGMLETEISNSKLSLSMCFCQGGKCLILGLKDCFQPLA